jgi:hypothetical protein
LRISATENLRNRDDNDEELGVLDGVDDAVVALADPVKVLGASEFFRTGWARVPGE